ncbi:VOC family protein [Mycobacterium sp.]|uniref:VOC family protein n=1 Tax=Mycobacterium sp. TaxID=1785 RepID=UPI002CD5F159|nr:VOC family protein [Mycobacterium sp.]HKP41834.1 VOC family protein [Mycobacterium sp.]
MSNVWKPTATDDAVVRYQIVDLDRGIEFYTSQLGFKLEQRAGPIAVVSRGALNLLLSAPQSSGAQPLADGQTQKPGGWNRIVLYVDDIAAEVDRLRGAGVTFLNDIKVGPGGKQVQITDPDGNSIELHEAPD